MTAVRTSNPRKLKADGKILYPIQLLDVCSEISVRSYDLSGLQKPWIQQISWQTVSD
jgi:hypothetical protein